MTAQLENPELDLVSSEIEEDTKKMATGSHSLLAGRVFRQVANHVEDNNLGSSFDATVTYDFKDGGRKRQPDSSFISIPRMPEQLDQYLTVAPDLAVEVVSKNDTAYEIEQKVDQYQRAGVQAVWVVYPFSRSIDVYKLATGLKKKPYNEGDVVEDAELLPGFKLDVTQLFKPPFREETNENAQ